MFTFRLCSKVAKVSVSNFLSKVVPVTENRTKKGFEVKTINNMSMRAVSSLILSSSFDSYTE